MININFTLIIQVINFIFLMWFLNKFLFKPVLNMLDERDKKITGDFEVAEKINQDVDKGLDSLENEMKKVRFESNELKNSIKNEGMNIMLEKLDEAKNEAKNYIEQFKKELEESKQKVEEELDKEVEVFAKKVSSNLLGREI